MITRRRTLAATAGGLLGATLSSTAATAQQYDRLQWKFQTGASVDSSPTVVDGTVFVGSDDANLYAVDADTGEKQWEFETLGSINSSPTVVDETVFVGSEDASLYAVNTEAGSQQWDFDTSASVDSSPTVVDGTVFVANIAGDLYAVDAGTGEQLWDYGIGSIRNSSTPSSPTVVDGMVFVKGANNNLYAVNANTGEQQWTFETGYLSDSSPTVVDGTVFVGSSDNNLYAVEIDTGEQQWAFETLSSVNSSPTVIEGNAFVGDFDGNLYAVDADTGERQWTFETGDYSSSITSSPTVVDGTVFVGSEDGNLYAVDAGNGEQQWAFKTGRIVSSSPTVVDGTVFVGSNDNNLYAVDAGVNGSSEGSRVLLGTEGHHGDWRYAGQSIDIRATESNTSWVQNNATLIAGVVGGVAGGKYLLRWWQQSANQPQEETSEATSQDSASGTTKLNEKPTNAIKKTTPNSGSKIDKHLTAAETAIEMAGTAESNNHYGEAIDSYNEALSQYQAALEGVETGAEEHAELKKAIKSTREELEAIKPLRDRNEAHLSVNNKLDTIVKKLDIVADNPATMISQSSQAEIATVEKLLQEANTTADKYEFDELAEQLAEQKKRYIKIKEQLQSNKPPTIIPAAPQFSLRYDDIEKGEPIGSGGNADVYRATATTKSGEFTLAIKKPRMSGTIDTNAIDQLINEAETWQQLDAHDHIVSVVDYGSTPLPWIGMEYMDGGNLSERAGELSFEQSLWTALAITKGVRYAHKRGVAHLDLKPTNILFQSIENAWDVPKVADWGLSKHLLEHSQSVEGMSPRYAAPEQLDQNQFGQTDTVTDVYQLGSVLYELFTEEPHFTGSTYEVMNKIQSANPTPPSDRADLPEEIDEIILTALATERADRYDDVLYIRDALQNLWNNRK